MTLDAGKPSNWTDLVGLAFEGFGGMSDQATAVLHDIMDAGRAIVGSSESGILVPGETPDELKFLVSANSKPEISEIVKRITVPADESLVGCVFKTGQLMAVANPESFYGEVDEQTGLQTNVYLAIPILDPGGEVLGVATFLNRPGELEQLPFNEVEIESGIRLTDVVAAGLRFAQRLSWQQILFQRELGSAAEQFATKLDDFASSRDSRLKFENADLLASAFTHLERLSTQDLELANELLEVLAARSIRIENDAVV